VEAGVKSQDVSIFWATGRERKNRGLAALRLQSKEQGSLTKGTGGQKERAGGAIGGLAEVLPSNAQLQEGSQVPLLEGKKTTASPGGRA